MSRVHRSARVGFAEASVIVTWTDLGRIEDIEEAIKAAARDAIRAARDQKRAHQ